MYVEIKTPRLLLRPFCISDLQSAHAYLSDEENTRYMIFFPSKTEEETAKFLGMVIREWEKSEPTFFEFAICLEGALIGSVSVYLDDKRQTGELGWILDRKYQKTGYALEAALAIKDFAFNRLKLKKLIAQCDYRNAPSYRLMEKIGMKLSDGDGLRTYTKRRETARELTYSLAASPSGEE